MYLSFSGVAEQPRHSEIVRILLEAAADANSGLPLTRACEKGHLEVVQLLLEAGADKNRVTYPGTTTVHLAVSNKRHEVLRLLLTARADKDAFNMHGLAPLHLACVYNSPEAVRLLLEARADKDLSNYSGMTPLHVAANDNDSDAPEAAQLLIQSAACVNKADEPRLSRPFLNFLLFGCMGGYEKIIFCKGSKNS